MVRGRSRHSIEKDIDACKEAGITLDTWLRYARCD